VDLQGKLRRRELSRRWPSGRMMVMVWRRMVVVMMCRRRRGRIRVSPAKGCRAARCHMLGNLFVRLVMMVVMAT
jgi:hypothetical protein